VCRALCTGETSRSGIAESAYNTRARLTAEHSPSWRRRDATHPGESRKPHSVQALESAQNVSAARARLTAPR
jgi:hypothetical protein